MAAWLAAGDGWEGEAARQASENALGAFRAWLGHPDPPLAERARGALGNGRAAALAGTFLREYLKGEGVLDHLSTPRRAEVSALIEEFFLASRPARR